MGSPEDGENSLGTDEGFQKDRQRWGRTVLMEDFIELLSDGNRLPGLEKSAGISHTFYIPDNISIFIYFFGS
jgi:hypothetical protein